MYPLALSVDGGRRAGRKDNAVEILDTATAQPLLTLPEANRLGLAATFSPDGRLLAVGLMDGRPTEEIDPAGAPSLVQVWDAAAGREVAALRGHRGPIFEIGFTPDGRRVATAGWDKTVRVWDATSGQELLILREHTGPVRGVAFSRDGRLLASAGAYGSLRETGDNGQAVLIWDGTPLAAPPSHVTGPVK
jgi:WD40 repeat protein